MILGSRATRLCGLVLGVGAALVSACRPTASPTQVRLPSPPRRPQLMFVSVAGDDTFHRVAVASLWAPSVGMFVTPLSCERVYFGGQRGLCLTSTTAGAATSWWADVFDETFISLHRVPLTGSPSRVRVSSDGRLAAATVFASGHSYADHRFSTVTTIIDLERGVVIGDLEQFETRETGRPIHKADFNFWGVTFSRDNDTFFATLDTGGVSYLVKGSVQRKRMEVTRPGVECPSLSPDNRRIAFKKRVGARSRGWWQIAVVDLDTLAETVVNRETRSVDDQVEWLDDTRIVYHLTGGSTAADLWSVRVDNTEPPQQLLASAYSPAIVR